eukprot:m.26275 g.26275  ORF g.26275 m.26275 type:complete len:176 (+) comp13300_c0_seq1:22-549(+)
MPTAALCRLVVHAFSSVCCMGALWVTELLRDAGDFKLIVHAPELGWFPTPNDAGVNKKGAPTSSGRHNVNASAGASCESVGRQELCNYLFNMATDPTETTNLFALAEYKDLVESMMSTYNSYADQEAPCRQCGETGECSILVVSYGSAFAPTQLVNDVGTTAATYGDLLVHRRVL